MKPPHWVPTDGDFYTEYTKIQNETGLSPIQKGKQEAELVEAWLGDVKKMCVSLLPHDDASILETPIGVYVTKYRDIAEVFENDDAFSAKGYGQRMDISSGAFMLGMDPGAVYEREHALVQLAMPLSDMTVIRRWVRQYAEGNIAAIAKHADQIDVIQEIGYKVPIAFVGHYFGVPGPSQEAWTAWLQMLALFIFNFWAGGAPFKAPASSVGLQVQTYINQVITQRQAKIAKGEDVPDDVLTRMLNASQGPNSLDEVAIRRNLGGLSIGCTMPPSGTFSFAIDYVMSLKESDPAIWDVIHQAAEDNDDALLTRCMMEAARLADPVPPTLFRTATQDYVLARGTPREKTILKDSIVVLVPSSGMMDPEMVDSPNEFRIDRPDWVYQTFGQGMHECLGREIGKVLLCESARAVLRLPNLRRAPGAAGQLSKGEGMPGSSYPGHLTLQFDKT